MRNFFSRPSPEPIPEDRALRRPIPQRPASRTSRSAAALFAAYGALTGAEGCIPQANTPRMSNAEWREAELARRAQAERRRIQELPLINLRQVHDAFYRVDPRSVDRRGIPPNAAAASSLYIEGTLPPSEIITPLGPPDSSDPADIHHQRTQHSAGGFYDNSHSDDREAFGTEYMATRLHEGERSFNEVFTQAVRNQETLRVTIRAVTAQVEGEPNSANGPTDTARFLAWRREAVMESLETSRLTAYAQTEWQPMSSAINVATDGNIDQHLAFRLAVSNMFIAPIQTLRGRLPGATRPTSVIHGELQVLLRNIHIQRDANYQGEVRFRITGERAIVYQSSQSSLAD